VSAATFASAATAFVRLVHDIPASLRSLVAVPDHGETLLSALAGRTALPAAFSVV
jgi:hypothetical protein